MFSHRTFSAWDRHGRCMRLGWILLHALGIALRRISFTRQACRKYLCQAYAFLQVDFCLSDVKKRKASRRTRVTRHVKESVPTNQSHTHVFEFPKRREKITLERSKRCEAKSTRMVLHKSQRRTVTQIAQPQASNRLEYRR